MALRPTDALLTRKCPICGQKMEINQPTEFQRALREHTRNLHPHFYAWTRRVKAFIVVALGLSIILGVLPAIFLQSLGSVTAEALGFAGFIAPLVVLGLSGWVVLKRSRRAWTAGHGQVVDYGSSSGTLNSEAGPRFSVPSQVNATDDIAAIARALAEKLEISSFEPVSVSWQDYVRTGFRGSNRPIMIPYDGCLIKGHQLILPESTRNRLEPGEWAPLVASELVYQRKLRENRRVGLLIRILPLTLVYILTAVALWQLGILNLQGMTTVQGAPTPVVVAFFYVYLGTAIIFAMVLYILLGLRFDRKMRLKADSIAVDLTGKTAFLSALEKIGRAFPNIMTKGRPSMDYPPGRPSVKKRIENIQASASF